MKNELYVTLTGSENTYLTYPCEGLLQVLEYGTNGSIIVAVFRVNREVSAYNGKFNSLFSAPVQVAKPSYQYDPNKSALTRWNAVADATGIKRDSTDFPNSFSSRNWGAV